MTRAKVEVIHEMHKAGYKLKHLFKCSKVKRATYYYLLKHPKQPTRPELHQLVIDIFKETKNGCGHKQIAMQLRGKYGVAISNKTALKIMHELGLKCEIRSGRAKQYSSYKGNYDKKFPNLLERNFHTDALWEKLGTDVTEFKVAGQKEYLAIVTDFHNGSIAAADASNSPNMEQQKRLLDRLFLVMPKGATPILHSDMGWQYHHDYWENTLKEAGIRQSMSHKGNCLDNAATEQVFGHLKDEFFRGQTWETREEFERDLYEYIDYWNSTRCKEKLGGKSPAEFAQQSYTFATPQLERKIV